MATAEQQAIHALQNDLAASRAVVVTLGQRFDALEASYTALTQAHTHLNTEADKHFREKSREIAALEEKLSQTLFKQKFDPLGKCNLVVEPKVRAFSEARRKRPRIAIYG